MQQGKLAWTFAITTIALFMTALDNLVVVTALPQIKKDLGASLSSLEWVVNAYTLTFAVLLLPMATLGDRFGRKLLFMIGMSIFTGASVIAALSHGTDMLIVARALQGIGAAIVTPLTLTILAEDTPPEKRGAILGAWGGIAGLAVAIGPIVGGALTTGISWQWIFWLNVPIGLVTVPLAYLHLRETKGPFAKLDIPGLVLVVDGLFCIVFGVVRSNDLGWGSAYVLSLIVLGIALVVAFCFWETRTQTPMLPMRFFRSRAFSAANGASVAMYFGMFGSIFLLTQFLQAVQGYSALGAGLRMLAWTGVTMLVAPAAGMLSDRYGGRPFMASGLALQAIALGWIAAIATPTVPYWHLVFPFVIAGVGMGLFFAPVANVVLSAVGWQEQGQASGANNALREIGGVFGIAVLAAIFSNQGGYFPLQRFIDGLKPAVWTGAVIVGIGALICLFIPAKQPAAAGAGEWSGAGGGDWSGAGAEGGAGAGQWSGAPAADGAAGAAEWQAQGAPEGPAVTDG
jgi:EmrB/QacA subfamily drug resistance transporter